ncbi:MAG: hypothetical protein JXQ29_10025 [Planctomycetes bacterium]|nr:hypothetical protein [Planctomycetota bacterium]
MATKIVLPPALRSNTGARERLIGFFDKYLHSPIEAPKPFQQSASTACFRLVHLLSDRDVFVKIYSYKGLRRILRGLFRNTFCGASRARHEWTNLLRLARLGVPVPEPVALIERRRLRTLRACALATCWEPDSVTADHFLDRAPPAARLVVAREIARLAGVMHDAGYADGDLHLRNLLVIKPDCAGFGAARPRVLKIDSPAGRLTRSRRRQIHDLASLDVGARRFLSRSERLRCWRHYCESRPSRHALRRKERRWLRAVQARADALEPKEGRRLDTVRALRCGR